jgi:hypothetical protein
MDLYNGVRSTGKKYLWMKRKAYSAAPFWIEYLEFLHRRLFLFGCRVKLPHGRQNTRVS